MYVFTVGILFAAYRFSALLLNRQWESKRSLISDVIAFLAVLVLLPTLLRVISVVEAKKPLRIVSRGDWGAKPPQFTEPMPHPIQLLRYVMNTGTPRCYNDEECIAIIRSLQDQHLEKGLGDIRYNFMLGDDGTVYEGRGWKCKPPKDTEYADKDGQFIEIAFIGDYRREIVKTKWLEGPMYEAQWDLLYYGDFQKFLAVDYDYIYEDDREPKEPPKPQSLGNRKKYMKTVSENCN